ncbi:ATP-dependent zinc metalloprotease FtsH [Flavitalea sp. BT771]|uniref:ATP-dependent zinc metalloprotease FtsH n=1 Tax=Flavitalea sp. BT771 TaxID=3063329 RepID=UPI0026E2E503|nr:ATP-dependent zinc metalloprotease FtsH [Flavitalea sp. BT771]MDO6429505.1 ATP-dependent zinc metalloprotease FtsH [Flavitalea sp. BT771]MDV6218367.1 ATP-dependent zinc metalloprotease FtsH [Flavitalea sp. BT771]
MQQDNGRKENGKAPRRKFRAGWWYVAAALVAMLLYFLKDYRSSSPRPIIWNDFEKNILARHAADSIDVINGEVAEVYIKNELADDPFFRPVMKPRGGQRINAGPHYSLAIGSVESFERKLDDAQKGLAPENKIKLGYSKSTHPFINLISWLLPLALLFFLWRQLTKSYGSPGGDSMSPFGFGRSTATLQKKEDTSNVTFNDVAGLEEAKQEVKEIVDFLKAPDIYTSLGAKIPRGVIIVGPPGTGKTLLAKAVAGEARVPFFSLSGSEFVEMFVGVGASRVRDLFRRAKEEAPCIIFIDEIDAVGRSRGKNAFFSGANDERESTLNQLLTEMDGFGTNSGVIVLAATNRADMLDPALLRPGRFDRHIYLELPDITERAAIFKVHLKPLKLGGEMIEPSFLAAQTPGFSGADIANICNEAALFAARRKSSIVEKRDFLDAIDRVVAGLEKKNKIISPEEKKRVAYHEAGHAIVSWLLRRVDPLVKVSIIPRGKSLGAAWYLPEERQLRTAETFTENMCAALGGRAAEEIVFGEVSSGALDDLEKVTKEAYRMVAYYGFDRKIGPISFYDSASSTENAFQKPYSEDTGRMIDEEVRKVTGDAYQRTTSILQQHRPELDALAKQLLEKETVYKEDLELLLGRRVL